MKKLKGLNPRRDAHAHTTTPQAHLLKMLETRTFDQLLRSGDVLDLESARLKLGYSAWGVRRLCHKGKLDHVELFGRYFFLKEQVTGAFHVVLASAATNKA